MPFRILFILLLITHYTSHAQNALAYVSHTDFLKQHYKPFSNVVITSTQTSEKQEWQGVRKYTVQTGNYNTDGDFHDYYFAVEYHDSLFINCHGLINVDCYANVLMRCGNYLFFTSVDSRKKEHKEFLYRDRAFTADEKRALKHTIGGVATAIIVGNAELNRLDPLQYRNPNDIDPNINRMKYCYLYDLAHDITYVMTPNIMTDLLERRKDLQAQYINGGSPDNETIYRYYLGLLYK